ncbi:MAG: MFS transporter [Collinsella intestinalis]
MNVVCLFISFVAIGVYELMTPFYLQDARGFDPGASGLIFCIIPLVNAVAGPISGAVSDRIGCNLLTVLGLGAFSVGLYLTGTLGMTATLPQILFYLGLASFGTSIFQSPNNSLIMGSVSTEMLGFAGSVSALARYLGMAVGISGPLRSSMPDERRGRPPCDGFRRGEARHLPVRVPYRLRRHRRARARGLRSGDGPHGRA